MELFDWLEREFKTGDYQKAVAKWDDGKNSPLAREKIVLPDQLDIASFFKTAQVPQIDRVLLGPWGFVLRKQIEQGSLSGVKDVLDIYEMKLAVQGIQRLDEGKALQYLQKPKRLFSKKEKLQIFMNVALESGNLNLVQKLYEAGARLKPSLFENKMTAPMMTAAMNGKKEIVVWLLEKGINHSFFNKYLKACFNKLQKNDFEKQAEVILKDGVDFQKAYLQERGKRQQKLIETVCCYQRLDKVLPLLKKDPLLDLNALDEKGSLPLAKIIRSDAHRDIHFALDMGADFLAMDMNANNLIAWALFGCSKPTFFQVLKERGLLKESFLHMKENYLTRLIKHGNKTALFLIRNGIDYDKQDSNGKTPLMVAVDWRREDVFDELMGNFADVNIADFEGRTALFYTIQKSPIRARYYEPFLIRLLDDEADINHQNNEGNTALMTAIQYRWKEGATILLNYGADVFIKNKKGLDAYNLAMQQGDFQTAKKIREIVRLQLNVTKQAEELESGLDSKLIIKNLKNIKAVQLNKQDIQKIKEE
ncbi:MAG: ankyrin repeat domain-containing protein [Alphaproteobacteria bacterium]|nr:ankyrin repeat domain-containing protein [Alphaproteobacteria bacterium]